MMKKTARDTRGAITLEATIVVTLFIFFMIVLYSLFVMFLAHNTIGHAILQASKSLSLDPHYTEKLGLNEQGKAESVTQWLANVIGNDLMQLNGSNPNFSSDTHWYKESTINPGTATESETNKHNEEAATRNAQLQDVVRSRVIGFLGETEAGARQVLDKYKVVGGLNGLDFSDSYVANGDVHVVVKYKLTFNFKLFTVSEFEFTQAAKSKLWK